MREPRQERRIRVFTRVAVVDALDAVLRHKDRIRADLERAKRRCRVRGEVRIAGSGGEDDDPALLEVVDRLTADVRLRDLLGGERRLDARLDPLVLEDVLKRERVQHRREHPGVIGGRALHSLGGRRHAAVEVAAADHDRDLAALLAYVAELAREGADDRHVDAVVAHSHECFAGELQQHPAEAGFGHPETLRRSNSTTSAPASFSACATVLDESCTQSWSTSTFAAKKRLFSIPSTIFSRACSGFDCTSSEFAKISRSRTTSSSGTASRATHCGLSAAMCIATLRPRSSSPPRSRTSTPSLFAGGWA